MPAGRVSVVFDERGEIVRYELAPPAAQRSTFAAWEEAELRALTEQAFELKGSPYFQDACQAIGDWYDRRFLARYERRQAEDVRLLEILRETDPDPSWRNEP